MKILVITVAGMSSRFSQSLGYECLKCIYTPNTLKNCLLYRMMHQPVDFDKYVIVGGYKYSVLEDMIKHMFPEYRDRIVLTENKYYSIYGSGYSLYLGLKEALGFKPDEIVFTEGDLYIDPESFVNVCENRLSVVTSNNEAILAGKAVAFYYDMDYKIHYIYDTNHTSLEIKEPFIGIFNSGQVWKFADCSLAANVYNGMASKEWQGTNLVFIQKYFQRLAKEKYINIQFKEWINCNTVDDFKRIRK